MVALYATPTVPSGSNDSPSTWPLGAIVTLKLAQRELHDVRSHVDDGAVLASLAEAE